MRISKLPTATEIKEKVSKWEKRKVKIVRKDMNILDYNQQCDKTTLRNMGNGREMKGIIF